jgi:PAS domain S-box-containing protein
MTSLESLDEFRSLVEHVGTLAILTDDSGVIRYGSPALVDLLGSEHEALEGVTLLDVVHPADRPAVREGLDTVAGAPDATAGPIEHRLGVEPGEWVWVSSRFGNSLETPLNGYLVFSTQVDAEERTDGVPDARERYSTLVDQIHDAVCILQDNEIVFANDRYHELLGVDPPGLVGDPFLEYVHPDDRDLVARRYDARVDPEADDPPKQYEFRVVSRTEAVRTVAVSATETTYGGEAASLVTFRDITEREEYEAELEALTEELETLNRVIRHDIRNDMAIVLGWAEMLAGHVDEEGQAYLEKILRSGNHVVETTKTARTVVDAVTGDATVGVGSTSLRSVLRSEIDLRRESFPDAEFDVTTEIPDVTVRANDMLSSVFRNLLNNAVQHSDADTPYVEVSCTVDGETVTVSIGDNGPGISEDRREAVFGKGEKGLESPGTGLGLYLVRTLVDEFGGDVWVGEHETGGAEFKVELQLAP